jgi:FixJ family two-component response regulator
LRSHGHLVTVFESAEACLAGSVDAQCVILDVALPGLSGLELHRRLQASGRALPAVFITAHLEPSVVQAVQRTRQPLVRKPLIEDDLIEAIARAANHW